MPLNHSEQLKSLGECASEIFIPHLLRSDLYPDFHMQVLSLADVWICDAPLQSFLGK